MSDSLKAASDWYIRLHAPQVSDTDRLAFQRWKEASPDNMSAWQRIQMVSQPFEGLEPDISKAVLLKRESISLGRRDMLKKLGVIIVVGSSGLLAYRQQPWQTMLADYATDKGESRTLNLPDETVLVLNTDTAVDTQYNESTRVIVLRRGEILIETGHGNGSALTFKVQTGHGTVTALGTRFSVRDFGDHIAVNVYEDSVLISPSISSHKPQTLHAGQTASFNKDAVSEIRQLPPGADLWSKGILSVNDMPLKTFLQELGRYYNGYLRCDPAIEHFPISGSFPLNNIDEILTSLQNTHPIRVDTVMKYWVTLKPA
jgi:transmembrane sensor